MEEASVAEASSMLTCSCTCSSWGLNHLLNLRPILKPYQNPVLIQHLDVADQLPHQHLVELFDSTTLVFQNAPDFRHSSVKFPGSASLTLQLSFFASSSDLAVVTR